MEDSPFSPDKFFKNACLFESGLIVVALVLGWLVGINPFANLHYSETAVFYGLVGTIPLYLMFLAMQEMSAEPVARIRQLLQQTLAPGLRSCNWADLCILATIAGVSEEALFRGMLQPWLESAWGMQAGLVVSNLVFGLVHAITPLYTILAALVGAYLALAMDFGGERNLLTPVIIHGLYDFLAFLAIVRNSRLA